MGREKKKSFENKYQLMRWLGSLNAPVVFYTYTKGFIGDGIVAAQNIFWKTYNRRTKKKMKSRFSHSTFLGRDNIVYESTIELEIDYLWKFIPKKIRIIYGLKKSSLDSYLKKFGKWTRLAVQQFTDVNNKEWGRMTVKAIELLQNKTKYGGLDLFGTLWVYLKWNWYIALRQYKKAERLLLKQNPFDTAKLSGKSDDVYCISAVSMLFKAIKKCFLNIDDDPEADVHISVATVDHGWYSRLSCNRYIVKKS